MTDSRDTPRRKKRKRRTKEQAVGSRQTRKRKKKTERQPPSHSDESPKARQRKPETTAKPGIEDDQVEQVPALLKYLKEEKPGVFVPAVLRKMTKNGDQAIVLAQILYWFDRGADHKHRARAFWQENRYLAKSHAQLAEEVGMTARRVKDCLAALRKRRLIRIEHHLWEGHKTTFIRPVVPAIVEAERRTWEQQLWAD